MDRNQTETTFRRELANAVEHASVFCTVDRISANDLPEKVRLAAVKQPQTIDERVIPLEMAEIVWGDGAQTYRKIIPLTETRPFGAFQFSAEAEGGNWKWARLYCPT